HHGSGRLVNCYRKLLVSSPTTGPVAHRRSGATQRRANGAFSLWPKSQRPQGGRLAARAVDGRRSKARNRRNHVRTASTAGCLHWATQRVGPAGFASLVASDRNTARRFAQAFLAHANGEILRCQTGSGGGTI